MVENPPNEIWFYGTMVETPPNEIWFNGTMVETPPNKIWFYGTMVENHRRRYRNVVGGMLFNIFGVEFIEPIGE